MDLNRKHCAAVMMCLRCIAAMAISIQCFCTAAPLQWEARSGYRLAEVKLSGGGKSGFVEISPMQIGIHFTNLLTLATGARNQNLLNSSGVAAGDFDNDGLVDLYFCSLEGGNVLYRNRGAWKFENVTAKAGVACPGMFSTGAMFADMNGDGLPDLLVTGNNGPNAYFVNLGNGTFTNLTTSAGLASKPMGSTSMAAGDLDGNGTLDLFVANYGENTVLRSGGEVSFRMINGRPVVSGRGARRLKIINGKLMEFGEPSVIYLNNGAGRFTPLSWTDGRFLDEDGAPLKELPNDLSLSVMMRDINGDGVPDIYVCNDFQTVDRIWINDGQARFRALPRFAMRHISSFSMGVDFADLDRDGRDDFMVADMLSRLHTLRMTQLSDTNMLSSVVGISDDRPEIRRNTLFWNRGDGTYAEIAPFAGVAATDWTWNPVFLDVDLDGYEDLLVSNGHEWDTQDLDVGEAQMRGAAPKDALTRLRSFPKLDTSNYAFRNRGNLTFEETGAAWGYNSRQVCHGIACADLDNDGDIDLVLSSLNAPPVICRNESVAPRIAVRLKGRAPNTRGINARITVRGGTLPGQSQEMISGGRYLSADEPLRVFAAGSLTNILRIEVRWRSGATSIVSNARANHIYEIEEPSAVPAAPPLAAPAPQGWFVDVSDVLQSKHHEIAFDDFSRQPLLNWKLSQLGPGIAWFDLDGDGRDELFVGTGRGGKMSVFSVDDKGVFTRADASGETSDDVLGFAGWVREPGKRELLAARAGYESRAAGAIVSIGNKRGGATRDELSDLPASPGALAVADYNGDGALDLFVAGRVKPGRYPEPASSGLYLNQNGRLLADATGGAAITNAGLISAAVWSDIDGDAYPELIAACEWGPLRLYKNDRGRLREMTAQYALEDFTGWWTSVTAGDFDNDGRMDLIAGNWGLNSSFHASRDNPARCFYGDFSGAGSIELVHAAFNDQVKAVVPLENLTLLAPVMPFLRARFPTYASSRSASIQEFFGERLARAKELRANTFASMLLLNRGNRFEPVLLPAEAQWAPVFGLCVADADGDGNQDVFLAQNFFATRKDIARLDSGRGLWLRGNGKGGFTSIPGQESGVVIWGEQRGAAVADYDRDGRVDLAVAQNGSATKLFRNARAVPGLRVRLKGPSGNPDGCGAVVWLRFGSERGPSHEIHCGAGYLSQDSAVTVLGRRGNPTHVFVRWPGGRTSEVPITAGQNEVTVSYGTP